jgi:hypothetical protein
MRQAGTKEYAHELVELLPSGQLPVAIEVLESLVGTLHLALVESPYEEGAETPGLVASAETLGRGEVFSHEEALSGYGNGGEEFDA